MVYQTKKKCTGADDDLSEPGALDPSATGATASAVKPRFAPDFGQHCSIAAAPFAEREILARHDACHPGEQYDHKFFHGQAGKRRIYGKYDHRIRPCFGKKPLTLVDAGQAKGRLGGPEEEYRVRIAFRA